MKKQSTEDVAFALLVVGTSKFTHHKTQHMQCKTYARAKHMLGSVLKILNSAQQENTIVVLSIHFPLLPFTEFNLNEACHKA